jgi:hypothetical protein
LPGASEPETIDGHAFGAPCVKEALAAVARPLLGFDFMYPMAYLTAWYDAYMRQMRWMGVVAAAILTVSFTVALGEPLREGGAFPVTGVNLALLLASFLLLGLSLLAVCYCLMVTYCWYVEVMHMFVRFSAPRMQKDGLVDEAGLNELLGYGTKRTARHWGLRSARSGILAGWLLAIGVIHYALSAIWFILASA